MNYTKLLRSLADSRDAAFAQNAANSALVRVLAVKFALASGDWRVFMADLLTTAEADLEHLPIPIDDEQRREVIREAAVEALHQSIGDLHARMSTGERCDPRPGDWDWPADLSRTN